MRLRYLLTIGALALLAPGPFLVVNGDTWTDIDFAREAVYQLEWFKLKPPSANDFALLESMGFGEPAA